MKILATAITAIALIATPAFAADMPVKAPPSAPAPVYNWTGWYVGVNLGASFGRAKSDFNAPGSVAAVLSGPGPVTASGVASGFDELYPGGFIGGGQAGFNWQLSPLWVVGVEADFQGADEKEHGTPNFGFVAPTFITGTFPPVFVGNFVGTAAFNYEAKIEWFGTARLRAGYLFGDGAVFTYVTGGLAYGKVDVAGTSTLSATISPVIPTAPPVTQAFDHSNVNTGWVVGSGTEGKLLIPGWTYKIEGLYMDLGHLDARGPGGSSTLTGPTPGFFSTLTTTAAAHTHFTDTILRAGLNYQFH